MSYTAGETLILASIRDNANFDADNTSRHNWKILNHGKSDHYAIIKNGGFAVEWISPTVYVPIYNTIVEVWQRYKDDGDTHASLYGYVNDVMEQLMPDKILSDTTGSVQDASIIGAEEPQEMWTRGGGPSWLRQEVVLQWREQNTVSY